MKKKYLLTVSTLKITGHYETGTFLKQKTPPEGGVFKFLCRK